MAALHSLLMPAYSFPSFCFPPPFDSSSCHLPVCCSAYDDVLDSIYAALTRTIIASPLPEASWFSAAEAAVSAIYALHPAPEQLCVAILKQMAGRAFQSRAVEAALAAGGGGEQPAGEQPAEDQVRWWVVGFGRGGWRGTGLD